jgi:hypothetical protein
MSGRHEHFLALILLMLLLRKIFDSIFKYIYLYFLDKEVMKKVINNHNDVELIKEEFVENEFI